MQHGLRLVTEQKSAQYFVQLYREMKLALRTYYSRGSLYTISSIFSILHNAMKQHAGPLFDRPWHAKVHTVKGGIGPSECER
jgi:hypothetical protein